ncbi:MAG: hypothetical protein KAW09_06320 [Thermoplasmata archaeon]|nr:hypothetical protein [Thermoplasmata archaeon]
MKNIQKGIVSRRTIVIATVLSVVLSMNVLSARDWTTCGESIMISGSSNLTEDKRVVTSEHIFMESKIGSMGNCSEVDDPFRDGNDPVSSSSTYTVTTMWTDTGWLYDVAVGDFDTSNAGNEVVVSGDSGNATMLTGSGSTWTATTMWTAPIGPPNSIRHVAIGDVDSSHSGNEVTVFDYHHATMLTGSGDTWNNTTIWDPPGSLHFWETDVGDFDPSNPGEEVVVVWEGAVDDIGFMEKINGSGSSWTVTRMNLENPVMRGVAVGDFDSAYPGSEVVSVNEGGPATRVTGSGATWTATQIWDASPTLLEAVAVGDVDSSHPGNEIVIAAGSVGSVTILAGSGTSWTNTTIWIEPTWYSDVAIGDFNSSHPGDEIVVVGPNVTMITGSGGSWVAETLWEPTEWILGVAVGDFDSSSFGDEIVVVGNSNAATMLSEPMTTGFSLNLRQGWNLISIPLLLPDNSLTSTLSSIDPHYDGVRYYNSSDDTDHWKSWMRFKHTNDLDTIDARVGFWVWMDSVAVLTVRGTQPTTTEIHLKKGWNMVGFPSSSTTYTIADLKAESGAVRVEGFDPDAEPYYLKELPESYTMRAGEGYWIHVASDCLWNISY